jgi:T5SS/PEP-CTERM-associated repeat protein
LVVGSDGDGSLLIEAGGSVSNNFGFVADFAGSTGTATVTGASSTWSNGNFFAVGQFGHGTLTIESGGVASDSIGFVGTQLGSSGAVTVTGAGSRWATSGNFVVGFEGLATLSVLSGGTVSSNNSWIAGATTSTCNVTVTGAGSNWSIAGRLAISEAFDPEELGPGGGNGSLFINAGGTVNAAQDVALFPGGHLHLQGGTLDAQSISFQGGGEFDWTSGTLHVGTFNGSLTNTGGTLAPGHSPGTTMITGNYAQQGSATLEIEIGGSTQGTQFDFVNLAGNALLDGQLNLVLTNGFTPTFVQTFVILDAASLTGAFDNVLNNERLATSDGSGSFLVHYGASSTFDPTQIVLSNFLAVTLPGDYNQDGKVDGADYVVWRNNEGTANVLPNDPFGGTIGPAQYNNWRTHFGNMAGSASGLADNSLSQAAVPEPAAILMLVAACLTMLGRR